MKNNLNIAMLFACGGLLAVASSNALADRGRGSIRAAAPPQRTEARPAPAREAPNVQRDTRPEQSRPEDRANNTNDRAQAGEDRTRAGEDRAHPDERGRPEERAHVEAPARRDWDDNDEDPHHFGGFGQGVPRHFDRGERVHALPDHYIELDFNRHHYFRDDVGAYYEVQPDGQYLIVQPPVGVVVAGLPMGAVPIIYGPTEYYYLDGVFYVAQANGFAVVNPPPGIVVPTLPTGANQVVINGTVVYQFEGFYYQPAWQDGVMVYTVNPA